MLDLKGPQIESTNQAGASEITDDDRRSERNVGVNAADSTAPRPDAAFVGGVTAFDHHGSPADARERRLERPGFRVAAIATVIALTVFGLVAVYTFVSNLSRRSSSQAIKVASNAQAAPLPFVPTPPEAQDYKEEAPTPWAPAPPEQQTVRLVDKPITARGVRATPVEQPLPKASVATSPVAPITTARVSNPPLPRSNSGGFDARLIRVRSRKTTAGFRYDLTFNMQEQAGRAAHWQRVLINTRSANGTSHSEAIPFSHRLGAAGALTFTISVEMTGRSEADWQGRIVCTTLGWDNKGAPLQSSFGANVTP